MKYIANAIPGSALIGKGGRFDPITADDARKWIAAGGWQSAIGHASTALALSAYFGIEIPHNRVTITLNDGDVILVAVLRGDRLAEGQVLTLDEVTARGFDFLLIDVDSGGYQNAATEAASTVSGGENNTACGICSTVGGGERNTAGGACSVVGGGERTWRQTSTRRSPRSASTSALSK